MSTINGIGSAFHGHSAPKRDGSYVTTEWFCVVLPLIPMRSLRVWPESSSRHLLGTYSSATFKAARVPLHWPHVFKVYGMYLAFYLLLVIAGRMSSGAWQFVP